MGVSEGVLLVADDLGVAEGVVGGKERHLVGLHLVHLVGEGFRGAGPSGPDPPRVPSLLLLEQVLGPGVRFASAVWRSENAERAAEMAEPASEAVVGARMRWWTCSADATDRSSPSESLASASWFSAGRRASRSSSWAGTAGSGRPARSGGRLGVQASGSSWYRRL